MEYDYPTFDSLGGTATAFKAADNPGGVDAAIERAFGPAEAPRLDAPPDTFVRLPFGLLHDGLASREDRSAQVRELNGADEEALARASGSYLRWMDTIIARGTVEVGGKSATKALLRELTVADRDTLLLAIGRVTYGESVKIPRFRCPACGELSDLEIQLGNITIKGPEDPTCRVYEVALRDGSATLRQPTGHDQMEFDGKELTVSAQNSLLLGRILVSVERGGIARPGSPALARELGMADRRILLDAVTENTYGPRYQDIAMTHEACGEEVPVPFAPGDIFRL